MKPMLTFVLPWLTLLAAAPATPPSPATMVEHERAFARAVADKGVRDGFLARLAPRGRVPGRGPVDGRKTHEAAGKEGPPCSPGSRPTRRSVATATSAGRPGRGAGVRAATGSPSRGEYLDRGGGARKTAAQGGAGRRRRARQARRDGRRGRARGCRAEAPRGGRGPLDRRRSLWKADADYGALAKQGGVAVALEKYAADGVILLREGLPRDRAGRRLRHRARAREGSATLMSLAQFLAESGDLGYTYGSFVTGAAAAPDSAYYVHVWHRGDAKPWEPAAEIVMPVPKPSK